MFGMGSTGKVSLDKDLITRLTKVADVAGYATVEEFITHILEKRWYILKTRKYETSAKNGVWATSANQGRVFLDVLLQRHYYCDFRPHLGLQVRGKKRLTSGSGPFSPELGRWSL